MFLTLSGEGASDIGTKNDEIGPMTKLVDAWIDRQIGYSLVESSFYTIIPKKQLTKTAKGIKPRLPPVGYANDEREEAEE